MPRTPLSSLALGSSGLLAGAWLLRHSKAPVVRSWAAGHGRQQTIGPLSVRTYGHGERVHVLLHGLISSGDIFGRAFDLLGERGRVLVPDLLGFGRSLDRAGTTFDLEAHLDALEEMLKDAGDRIVFGGHSLGALLSLHWAARHPERVERVVTWGAPLYDNPVEAHKRMASMGPVQALFTSDGPLPRVLGQAAFTLHPQVLANAVALTMPQLPTPLAHTLIEHTWPSYRQSMEILLRNDWRGALKRLSDKGIPVLLSYGLKDRAIVAGRAESCAEDLQTVSVEAAPGIRHEMVLSSPARCMHHLTEF